MNVKERDELRSLRDRLIKLETTIKLEFSHMHEDWKVVCESIHKLNEEYGRLIQRQADLEVKESQLEAKFKEAITNWKLASLVISPIVTTVIVIAIHYLFGIYA